MTRTVRVAILATAMTASILAACQDQPLQTRSPRRITAGELHNELILRSEQFDGAARDRMRRAALELRGELPFASEVRLAEIDGAILWGERIAPRILELLDSRPSAAEISVFLQREGVAAGDAVAVASVVEATLLRGALPAFSKPAASEVEALFRDVALHSSRHWSSRGKMNKDQKIIIADAIGALLGAGWGPFGGIAGAAIVSVIAAG